MNFCISPSSVNNEYIFSEFGSLFSRLNLHKYCTADKFSLCKTRLVELPSEYPSLSADRDFLAWQSVHFQTIKSLKPGCGIYLTKPDKSFGVVILNNQDYIIKMVVILHDSSMFRKIVSVDVCDNTNNIAE